MSLSPEDRRAHADVFLDRRLATQIGPVDDDFACAIADEIDDAVAAVLGRYLPLPIDTAMLAPTMAYWAFDIARGLHWLAVRGRQCTTTELVWALAPRALGHFQVATIARDVDLVWALGHGRYVDQIFGLGALHLPSTALRGRYGWLDAALLGHRIDLVIETIRLTAPSTRLPPPPPRRREEGDQ
jgi:hypothetical protein